MPTIQTNIISLELSFDELRWLAGAFGATRLPLTFVDVPPKPLSETQTLLQQRGIIQRGASGWQMEPFAALVLQWMLSAPRYWLFERFTRDCSRTEITMFEQDGATLLVLSVPHGKRFIVCRDVDTAITEWQLSVNLPLHTEMDNLPEWDISQPVTVIRNCWERPELAKTMAPTAFLDWAASLDWAGEWFLVQGDTRFARLALAARGSQAWAGKWVPGKPGEFVLKAYCAEPIKQMLGDGV